MMARRISEHLENTIAQLEEATRRPEQQREELLGVIRASALRAEREIGAKITSHVMERVSETIGRLGLSEEEGYHCFLRETAVDYSVAGALASGVQFTKKWGNVFGVRGCIEDYVRLALKSSESTNYDEILAKADRAVQISLEKSVFVAQVTGYRREGCELVVSFSTLGGKCSTVRVEVGAAVTELMARVQDQRTSMADQAERVIRCVSRNDIEVKLIGPAGTILEPTKFLPEALDYETDAVASNVQQGASYPLEVLTGDAWRSMGLDGATRWKYVEDTLFMKLFGMGKASFEKLPIWKQTPLKKKHGLF